MTSYIEYAIPIYQTQKSTWNSFECIVIVQEALEENISPSIYPQGFNLPKALA